jgi:4-hydroxy-tetrahydrodipicolinate synthase
MSLNTDWYGGVIAAMITPCSAPGTPDPAGMRRLAQTLIEQGCHGLFVIGSTGELPLIDEDQRRELVAAAREGAGANSRIYAGISGFGVKQSIRYACNAAKDGADVAIVMAPFFLKTSQTGLYEYVLQIAEASPIPVGIYNHFRMPSVFEMDTVMHLAEHENIVAIKDTSTEVSHVAEMSKTLDPRIISVLQGREPFILDSLKAGAAGCVCALANIAPEIHRELYDAVQRGELDEAQKCQDKIDAIGRIFTFDEVKASFAGFAYAIRKIAQLRGWLEKTDGMMPGQAGSTAFDHKLKEIASASGK